jgi:hypothetical protein
MERRITILTRRNEGLTQLKIWELEFNKEQYGPYQMQMHLFYYVILGTIYVCWSFSDISISIGYIMWIYIVLLNDMPLFMMVCSYDWFLEMYSMVMLVLISIPPHVKSANFIYLVLLTTFKFLRLSMSQHEGTARDIFLANSQLICTVSRLRSILVKFKAKTKGGIPSITRQGICLTYHFQKVIYGYTTRLYKQKHGNSVS